MEILLISWSGDVWRGFLHTSEPRGPRWRAMFQDYMARRTCFKEQYYTGMKGYYWAGKIAGPDPRKLYMKKSRFFIDISGCIDSFGVASFVVSDMGVLLLWIAAGLLRKSMWERLGDAKVASMHANMIDFMIRGSLTMILRHFRAQGLALTRNVSRSPPGGQPKAIRRGFKHCFVVDVRML